MTSTARSAATWKEIAELWRRLGELAHRPFEESLRLAAAGLESLMGGSHVLLVIQRRLVPKSAAPLNGFQPLFSRDFGPDAAKRLEITRQWAAHEPRLADDPVLGLAVANAGTLRVVRHRADVDPEAWSRAPTRRLLEQLKLEDRINGIIPVSPTVEVSFCIDRPLGAPVFDDADRLILMDVLEGLRPLAAKFVRCHGFMQGQQPLDDTERRVMTWLLRSASEVEIAESLDLDRAQLTRIAQRVYDKLNVDGRLELVQLWIDGRDRRAERPAPTVESAAPVAAQSPLESGPLVSRVRESIDRALDDGECDIEAVATELGLSVRALQRELRRTPTSFRELVEDGRRNRARILLSRPWLTLTDIALKLGYSQVSSFNRAVKRWTGQTPSQLRQELLDEA